MNTDNQLQKNTIHEQVLEKIRTDELSMTSKTVFTLKAFGIVCIVIATLLLSIVVASFALFSLRVSGESLLLGFGLQGVLLFLAFFPWKTFILTLLLIVILEWLIRRFQFGYRSPVVFLLLGLVVVTVAIALIVEHESLHDRLMYRADKGDLPFVGMIYTQVDRHPPRERGVCRCVVTLVDGNMVIVKSDDDAGTTTEHSIILPLDTATSSLMIGERVFIIEDVSTGLVRPFGIKKI